MATLTTAQKALVTGLIKYMDGEYEKPLDDRVAHDLSTLHTAFGYTSQITYLDDLRDRPFSTLLKSLLAVAA
jgi:hypothetical protein